jgi:hypothetical protein
MSTQDPLLRLLARFREEGVEYVLVGGQAMRWNGYLRATEGIDVLVRASRAYGEKIIRALSFLASSAELKPEWFAPGADGTMENIRVADDLLVDLLFAANGKTYESVQQHVRELEIEGVRVRVLNIDGLLETETDHREKDVLDKGVLMQIKQGISGNDAG